MIFEDFGYIAKRWNPCRIKVLAGSIFFLERSSLPRAEKLSAGGYSEKSETEVITRKPVVRLWKAREQTETRRQIGV